MEKLCKRCNRTKPFARKGKGFQTFCKTCSYEIQKAYYRKNPDKHKERIQRKNKRAKVRIAEFVADLKSAPCLDCGVSYPYYVMDFDHREGEKKLGLVTDLIRKGKLGMARREIEKCDLICSNCHRERTQQRLRKLKV